MPDIPELKEVVSDNIFAIGYDAEAQKLFVRFKSRPKKASDGSAIEEAQPTSLYRYEHVTETTHRQVMSGFIENSVGTTFNSLVKGHSTRYPYTKLEHAPGDPVVFTQSEQAAA